MAVWNLEMLGMVSEQSRMSNSFTSFQVRNYVKTVQDNAQRYAHSMTDLRDHSVRLEMNTGQLVQSKG